MLFRSWINVWYRYYLYQEQQEFTIKLSRIWGARGMHPQSNVVFFIFMQFSALSNRWAPPGLAPLRNPGSATVKENYSMTYFHFYRPQTNCEGYVFTGVCLSTWGGVCGFILGGVRGFIPGGVCGFIGGCVWFYLGGHAWFYSGVCSFIWGVYVVLLGGVHGFIWGCAWFYLGGCAWFYLGGACVVLFGGHVWFYLGGVHGFIWAVCMVLFGERAWFYSGAGGMHGIIRGACVVLLGGCVWFYSGVGGMCGFFRVGACVVFSVFSDTMRYGQWAGGTHPTGMHSCKDINFFGNWIRLHKRLVAINAIESPYLTQYYLLSRACCQRIHKTIDCISLNSEVFLQKN